MSMLSRWTYGVLIGIDQLGNAILGGNPDETISSRIGRLKDNNGGTISSGYPVTRLVDNLLEWLQPGHSHNAVEPWTHDAPYVNPVHDATCLKCGNVQERECTPAEIGIRQAWFFCPRCNGLHAHDINPQTKAGPVKGINNEA